MQIGDRFVNNWYYSVKQWLTLNGSKHNFNIEKKRQQRQKCSIFVCAVLKIVICFCAFFDYIYVDQLYECHCDG